jgi:hypothetical protein
MMLTAPSLESQGNQGIEGHVYRLSGNQMPSPDRKPNRGQGIATTLYIYELTNLHQVTRVGQSTFYSLIRSKLLKTIQSDSSGSFQVYLPEGQYSLFTKIHELFYANLFDAQGNIAPVQVFANQMTKVEFKIDFDASY